MTELMILSTYPIVYSLWSNSKIYIMWLLIHYATANIYPYLCAETTLIGFITAPFNAISPQCQSLQWLFTTSTNIIKNMWIVLGSWLILQIKIP